MASDVLEFTCPRCDTGVSERYYGPCTSCRTEMRAAASGLERDIETEGYVPKMNVVPNQIATKD